jgi:CheY-like chemotaxis protein/uncharacterized protein (DUF2225 family)
VQIEQSIKVLAKRKLVLADPNPRTRGEMGRYLRSIGMEVAEASSVDEACEMVRTGQPAMVAVDMELPGDPCRVFKAVAERRHINEVKTVLTCRATARRERLVPMVSTGAQSGVLSAVIITPCRPETMIERLARVLMGDEERQRTNAAVLEPVTTTVDGNNSLLLQRVLCPYHDRETRVKRYALRLNRIETEANFFDVPVYTKAVNGADYVNYHQLCVTVCPECYFASADPAHFVQIGDKKHAPAWQAAAKHAGGHHKHASPISHSLKYAVMARARERQDMVEGVDESFFSENRSMADAVKSFELALNCSELLHKVSRHTHPDELIKQGNYHLRLAHLQESLGVSQVTRDKHIEQASRLLREAYPNLSDAAVPRGTYQVVATSIYLNEDREAHQYLSQLARWAKTVHNPEGQKLAEQYLYRSAKAWECREYHRKPVVEPEQVELQAPFIARVA